MKFSEVLIRDAIPSWEKMLDHPFVKGMRDGTLEKEKFREYLVQDTIYLKYYSKVYAWGMIKSDDTTVMRMLYRDMDCILADESMMHIRYLKEFGLSDEQALARPMKPETKAYLDFMLSTSEKAPLADGLIGLMPCAFSYYYLAKKTKERAEKEKTFEENYFRHWMEHYAGEGYAAYFDRTVDLCDRVTAGASEPEKERLLSLFRQGTEHEWNFWDMAYKNV